MIEDTGKGYTLKQGGRYLASPYAPQDKAERMAQRSILLEKCIYIIPSPLFGYGLTILLDKLPASSYILCIEQDQEVMKISSPYFPEKAFENDSLDYIRSENIKQIIEFLQNKGWGNFRKCDLLLLNGVNPDKPFYASLLIEIQQQLNAYWKNRMTMIELGNRWISNIIRNLKYVEKSKPFPQTEKPLLICGAGTSLSKCISEIQNHRSDYYILSVDTALPALKGQGIYPDAVVNLDGQYYNSLDFYPPDDNVYTLSDLTSYPSTLRKGSYSLFLSRFCNSNLLDLLEEALGIPIIPALGSVGVSAFELSCRISRGPIILCGLDFAYIPGASHVKGSIFHQHYLNKNYRFSPNAGLTDHIYKRKSEKIDQAFMRSDSLLKSYHAQLLDYLKQKNMKVFQWRQKGLPLGLEEWDPAKYYNLLESASDTPMELTKNDVKHPEMGKILLNQWKEMLQKILRIWDKYQQTGEDLEILLASLTEADLLYLGASVTPPEPSEDPKVLTLLILRCRKLLALIQRIYD